MSAEDQLIWIDLEMTGLDLYKERILEIAVLVTDADLEIVAAGPELVIHQPDEILDAMDEWNTTHHGESGLTERSRGSTVTETDAQSAVLEFLEPLCPPGVVPLAGNTVHQDRAFMHRYMPELEAWMHYRNVDVSTLKELVRRWYPETYARLPAKRNTHRALEDIRESIEELRFYREHLFR